MHKTNYKAVIFDLDGTLLNTVADLAHAMNSVLHKHGLAEHPVEAYKNFVGRGLANLARVSLPPNYGTLEFQQEIYMELLQAYHLHIDQNTVPYPHIYALLDELSALGIKMAILSNKGAEFMPKVVQKYFAKWVFVAVVGASPGVPAKPDSTSARQIIRQLQCQPTEIIYLGDTDVDMQTATAANLLAIGAGWGFRSAEELLAHGASKVLNDPLELLRFFAN